MMSLPQAVHDTPGEPEESEGAGQVPCLRRCREGPGRKHSWGVVIVAPTHGIPTSSSPENSRVQVTLGSKRGGQIPKCQKMTGDQLHDGRAGRSPG